MAIQDKNVTLVGAQAVVGLVGIAPQGDGSILIEIHGRTKDAQSGADVHLQMASLKIAPGQLAVIDSVLARALTELRKANGLEV